MVKVKVGDKVLVCCRSSIGDWSLEKEILHISSTNLGYHVIEIEGGRRFRSDSCTAITPPYGYFMVSIYKVDLKS